MYFCKGDLEIWDFILTIYWCPAFIYFFFSLFVFVSVATWSCLENGFSLHFYILLIQDSFFCLTVSVIIFYPIYYFFWITYNSVFTNHHDWTGSYPIVSSQPLRGDTWNLTFPPLSRLCAMLQRRLWQQSDLELNQLTLLSQRLTLTLPIHLVVTSSLQPVPSTNHICWIFLCSLLKLPSKCHAYCYTSVCVCATRCTLPHKYKHLSTPLLFTVHSGKTQHLLSL